ncbi:TetR/AcrR family transcriptional regulator [Embleya sp. NPDC050154]|uniref:TetR/AcrR family transcriptional regulator n=1 Tax=unclassified Embleya TaxID=2699296 RepID=UPI0037940B73
MATNRTPGRAATTPRKGSRSTAGRPTDDWMRKRREILDVAAEVFFTSGFDRGTTKEIAARVGMSQPSLYHYVGSKEDLMSEIARQVYRDFTQALDEALSGDHEPREQLRRVIHAFVATLVVNQHTFAVYWKEYRAIPAPVAREARAQERAFVERVERVVSAAQKQGVLSDKHSTRILSEGILGMMSWVHWWFRPGESSAEEISAAFCDLVGLVDPND